MNVPDDPQGNSTLPIWARVSDDAVTAPTSFMARLAAMLGEPEFQQWEGFPGGSAETILARSLPPTYTACPNPFLEQFINQWRAAGEPVNGSRPVPTVDAPPPTIAPGVKTGSAYLLHTYHSKIPPTTVAALIDHHCASGSVILDPFAGSGMTGVATDLVAQMQAKALLCIQSDLSPAATFIASSYSARVDAAELLHDGDALLTACAEELAQLYCDTNGPFDYTIYSDLFCCPHCNQETLFWDAAVDQTTWTFRKPLLCQSCQAPIRKRRATRTLTTAYDPLLARQVTQVLQVPVARKQGQQLVLLHGEARGAAHDRAEMFPIRPVPIVALRPGANLSQPQKSHGISHVHHLFTWRNLSALGLLWERASHYPSAPILHFILTSFMLKTGSKLHNIGLKQGAINLAGQLPNTYYIPNLSAERNIGTLFANKLTQVAAYYAAQAKQRAAAAPTSQATILTSTGSATQLPLADNSIDYCITDPPFGGFVNYSELNLVWEAWLGLQSAHRDEAIVYGPGGKSAADYQAVMGRAFSEIYRVLKPGHWLTLVFHNSSNTIWGRIQEALLQAGFVVTDVQGLGRGQGSYKQMTATVAVKTDLLVSAYKPEQASLHKGQLTVGTEEAMWSLIEQRLAQLPLTASENGNPTPVVERQNYQLFDYMVAHHVQHGLTVPLSAGEFYAGLDARFVKREEGYFLGELAE